MKARDGINSEVHFSCTLNWILSVLIRVHPWLILILQLARIFCPT